MRIAIDCDGVLSDFTTAFSRLAVDCSIPNARVIPPEEVQVWQWPTQQQLWSPGDESFVWRRLKISMNWWMTLDPLISAEEVELFNRMVRDHDVYIITSRPRTRGLSAEWQTTHWLEGLGVHMGQRGHVVATKAGTKGNLARALDLDLALDDNLDNLSEFSQAGCRSIARRWKYNQEWMPAVASFRQFYSTYVGAT